MKRVRVTVYKKGSKWRILIETENGEVYLFSFPSYKGTKELQELLKALGVEIEK